MLPAEGRKKSGRREGPMLGLPSLPKPGKHPLEEKGRETPSVCLVNPLSMPVVVRLSYAAESPGDV